jgi:hypothetical protein
VLASGSTDRTVKLVDLETLNMVGQTRAEGSGGPVCSAVFAADGSAVLSVSGDYLKVCFCSISGSRYVKLWIYLLRVYM